MSLTTHTSASLSTPGHPGTAQNRSSPVSASSNNTYLISASPTKHRRQDVYRPKVITTVGARPACLVNASVTYVGNDQIYAFGGFDQYTDEVYNHVLRLNLSTKQWGLVDNFGDIPGVRMGHTANLWQGDKLLVYGGENEHRAYLSDVIIFDVKSAHWIKPELHGPTPRGRARHAAVIFEDKLYVIGGMTGNDNYVLDDICFLDLKTWTWSRTWRFVPRYDHTSWVWGGRIWVFGGMGEDMERSNEVWWLDIRGSPVFESPDADEYTDEESISNRQLRTPQQGNTATSSTGHAANSSSIHITATQTSNRQPPVAPGSISSIKFVSSSDLPTQALGTHFHVYSSGCLLDFVTPATIISSVETSLTALDLDTLRWRKLADGKELFRPNYRWHYCATNEDATQAWLLGCQTEATGASAANGEEYLSDVLPIDLRRLGLLGNKMSSDGISDNWALSSRGSSSNNQLSGLGADLAKVFDRSSETSSGADFAITAEREETSVDDGSAADVGGTKLQTSQPINVHKMILRARWPHFDRLYASQMAEFHTKKMHIPEPYRTVRSFLYYIYTDSISSNDSSSPSLADVAGMLVMSNIYDMPQLRLLCISRLSRELNVDHAALIWERASTAGEEWLKRRAGIFCMLHWGRIVRTLAFRNLDRNSLMELCEEVDAEGRVVCGDELEAVGGLGGMKFGVGGVARESRKRRAESVGVVLGDDTEDTEDAEDEGMELS